MDQARSLSAALLLSPSAPGGLLSQKGATEGSASPLDGLFASLLSTTGTSQATPAEETRGTATAALSQESSSEMSTTASPDQISKNANDLLVMLQKILAVLRRNETKAAAEQESVSSDRLAETESETSELLKAVSAIVENLTEAAESVESSTSSDSEKKSASEIILELLALMQLVVQTMQKNPLTEGGADAPPKNAALDVQALATAQNALTATTNESLSTADAKNLFAVPPEESSLPETGHLLDLLKKAEEAAETLLEGLSVSTAADDSITTGNSVSTSVADAVETLTQLETDIQTALADLKQQIYPEISRKEDVPSAMVSREGLDSTTGITQEAPLLAAAKATDSLAPSDYVLPGMPQDLDEAAVLAALARQTAASAALKGRPSAARSVFEEKSTAETSATTEKSAQGALLTLADILPSNTAATQEGSDLLSEWTLSSDSDGSPPSFLANSNVESSLSAEGSQASGVYSFASTLSAFRATRGGTRGLPAVVDQVILYLNRNVKNGESQMSLQLQPSDLGKISVKLEFSSDGRVQGSVVADNPKTLEMLEKDSRSLERALQDAGLRAEPGSLDFSLSGQKSQDADAQGTGENGLEEASLSAESDETGSIDAGALSENYYITPTGVNIRV